MIGWIFEPFFVQQETFPSRAHIDIFRQSYLSHNAWGEIQREREATNNKIQSSAHCSSALPGTASTTESAKNSDQTTLASEPSESVARRNRLLLISQYWRALHVSASHPPHLLVLLPRRRRRRQTGLLLWWKIHNDLYKSNKKRFLFASVYDREETFFNQTECFFLHFSSFMSSNVLGCWNDFKQKTVRFLASRNPFHKKGPHLSNCFYFDYQVKYIHLIDLHCWHGLQYLWSCSIDVRYHMFQECLGAERFLLKTSLSASTTWKHWLKKR